jgi:hypothetical protein
MVSLQDQFLKALMERFGHPEMAAVIAALPEELASKFRVLPDRSGKAPELFFVASKRVLLGMHPGWFEELAQLCPQELQPVIRTALLEASGRAVSSGALSPSIREFLLHYLVRHWPEREVEGVEYIENASFPWLLTCDEHVISKVVELLAVNDVVDVVRQTVDKKILQKILMPLTASQQRYLRSCLHRPARSATLNKELTALLLEDSKMAEEKLRMRGFEDMGQALKDEPPLFIWHMLHHIDKETARILKNEMEKEGSLKNQKGIKKRLSHAYEFLQKVETL